MTLVDSLRMEASAALACEGSLREKWAEDMVLLSRKMAAAADEIERLTCELEMERGLYAELNKRDSALYTEYERLRAGISDLQATCCGHSEEKCHGCRSLLALFE